MVQLVNTIVKHLTMTITNTPGQISVRVIEEVPEVIHDFIPSAKMVRN